MRVRRLLRKTARYKAAGVAVILGLCATTALAIAVANATTEHAIAPPGHPKTLTPPQPRSELAAKAYLVFKHHCARCHQKGRPTTPGNDDGLAPPPARGGPDAILDLAKLARRPGLVTPGLPDASRLYNAMISRRMPPRTAGPPKTRQERRRAPKPPGPSAADLEAVRTWIASLEPNADRCASRRWVTQQALHADIERYVAGLPPARAARTRFVSLAHLSNACATSRQLKTYRAALGRLFNRLSWQKLQARLTEVDAAALILAVDIDQIGWPVERWDWLTGHLAPDNELGARLNTPTRNALDANIPVVRADWLAHMASNPDIYASLLGLPLSVRGLRAKLRRVYPTTGWRQIVAQIAAVEKSRLTSGPRLIARHAFGERGFIWEAVDAHPNSPKSHSLGQAITALEMLYETHREPEISSKTRRGFREVTLRRFLFRLPNGHIGVMATDRDGHRIDHAARHNGTTAADNTDTQTGTDTGDAPPHQDIAKGMACMACHSRGVVPFTNALKRPVRRPYRPLLPPKINVAPFSDPALAAALANDNHGFANAARRSGGNIPFALSNGDPVHELARSYSDDLDLITAAANAWLQQAGFSARLERYDGPLTGVARRLRHGVIGREEFERLSAALGLAVKNPGQRPSANAPPKKSTPERTQISLWSDKPRYKAGDTITIFAQPTQPCRLSVIGVDGDGVATVLFPNGFAQDNLVAKGQIVAIPPGDAAYRVRVNHAGVETFVAMCALPDVETLPGIDHDFDVLRFTELGNWRNHISAAFELEAKTYARGHVPKALRRKRRRRGRRRPKKRPSWLLPGQQPFISARIAISIPIER